MTSKELKKYGFMEVPMFFMSNQLGFKTFLVLFLALGAAFILSGMLSFEFGGTDFLCGLVLSSTSLIVLAISYFKKKKKFNKLYSEIRRRASTMLLISDSDILEEISFANTAEKIPTPEEIKEFGFKFIKEWLLGSATDIYNKFAAEVQVKMTEAKEKHRKVEFESLRAIHEMYTLLGRLGELI